MFRWNHARSACLAIGLLISLAQAATAGPRVLKTEPADGADNVAADTTRILVVFDEAMKTDGYSILQVGDGAFPEMTGEQPVRFTDERTLVIQVKLSPQTAYAVALNSEQRRGFKSADGTPLVPTVIRFTTVGRSEADSTSPEQPKPPRSPLADLYDNSLGKTVPQPNAPAGPDELPKLSAGWTLLDDKLYGTQVAIPPGWTPRVRGGAALCIDPDDVEKAGAFFVPVLLKQRIRPDELADNLDEILSRSMPDYQTRTESRPTEDSVQRSLTGTSGGTRVAGTYRAIVSRSGMGFIMGYLAPPERLEQLRPMFHEILGSYRFVGPKIRLQPFKSAAVELQIPPGWQVQTSEANGTANQDIDWVVTCPQMPGARVFMYTPKYCTMNWITDAFNAQIDQMSAAMWRNKGYEAANIGSDQEAFQAALGKVIPGLRIIREHSIDELRELFAACYATAVQAIRQTGGRWDFYVYELQGQRQVQGVNLRSVVYLGASVVVTPHTKGPMGLWSIQIRGYEAPAEQFAQVATLLERVCTSFTYSSWWIREVQKANEQEARQIREFWAHMNKVDREIWDNRTRTQSAINEMMYNSLIAGTPGYVNTETGTIETIPTEKIDAFRDESGQVVSPEELIDKKIDPHWATRLREANADDYMNYDRRVHVWP
ncbi:MAG: Ig-like domain-containing protein [Phycisphaerales bacterium]|nr:Ig-like domain-containing protein [Phycisphaerales bacterium]